MKIILFNMDKEIKQKWVNALRSDKYTQDCDYAQLRINKNGTTCHCVLGVLAEEAGLEISECGSEIIEDSLGRGYKPLHKFFDDDRIIDKMYMLNDSSKLSFNELADYIEENL